MQQNSRSEDQHKIMAVIAKAVKQCTEMRMGPAQTALATVLALDNAGFNVVRKAGTVLLAVDTAAEKS